MSKILNKKQKNDKTFGGVVYTKKDTPSGLFNALRWVCGAVSTDESRFFMTGVYFTRNEKGNLRLVATDGCRLHIIDDKSNRIREYAADKFGVEFPDDTILSVHATAQEVAFSRPIDGKFPDYNRVIPHNSRVKFAIGLEKKDCTR
ncbi:MAG: hypothetical protein Ta2B_11090 [Termitinemataceae bacterium]|nr:MAG: hypothetical protein Ta2B_11090 [Termitinemataceae bacterium]